MDFDAIAAYDSIIPALATVTCMQMGLPRYACDFMTHLINQMEYSVHGTPAVFKHPNFAEGQTEDYAAQFVDDNQQQKSTIGLLSPLLLFC